MSGAAAHMDAALEGDVTAEPPAAVLVAVHVAPGDEDDSELGEVAPKSAPKVVGGRGLAGFDAEHVKQETPHGYGARQSLCRSASAFAFATLLTKACSFGSFGLSLISCSTRFQRVRSMARYWLP